MQKYQIQFDTLMGVKTKPNAHELALFARAEKYIAKLTWIPGIEMIAVVNSLSMYATHEDSDIDLFIITQPGMLWFVRLCVTLTLWRHGVWRHGVDIAGNFCLSFYVTTDAIDMNKIAIDDDIYLYNWIYHLKPILSRDDVYEQFLVANSWVEIDEEQKQENLRYLLPKIITPAFCHPYEERICSWGKNTDSSVVGMTREWLNQIICFFWMTKTLRKYKKLGSPEGVIISDTMLKFHDQDRRKQIRDTILEKNFDK